MNKQGSCSYIEQSCGHIFLEKPIGSGLSSFSQGDVSVVKISVAVVMYQKFIESGERVCNAVSSIPSLGKVSRPMGRDVVYKSGGKG